jgi:hypothetical protein
MPHPRPAARDLTEHWCVGLHLEFVTPVEPRIESVAQEGDADTQ